MRSIGLLVVVSLVSLVFANPVLAQHRPGAGAVLVPKSSIEHPGDAGVRAHTNIKIFMPEGGMPQAGPPFPGFFYETPASIACLYGLVSSKVTGCNPNTATANPTGGSGAIAIVDAFDDPNAASDLASFNTQFGLASSSFQVVYATGTQPPLDPTGGWELEESLDIEWAHAMAPNAKLYLVEAASNSLGDLINAELVASSLVTAAGGGQVSNSWSSSEFDGENTVDPFFVSPKVVFFASTGDNPGVGYPSASPNVFAAGGTTISRNPATGSFQYEGAWDSAGGGISAFENRPSYQNGIASLIGGKRATPDLSFDSNPITGVWVLDTNLYQGGPGGWFILGGTSVASPSLAGIVNAAGHHYASSNAELGTIYRNLGKASIFNDVKLGACGPYAGYLATTGWDVCTGVGSPNGKDGK